MAGRDGDAGAPTASPSTERRAGTAREHALKLRSVQRSTKLHDRSLAFSYYYCDCFQKSVLFYRAKEVAVPVMEVTELVVEALDCVRARWLHYSPNY